MPITWRTTTMVCFLITCFMLNTLECVKEQKREVWNQKWQEPASFLSSTENVNFWNFKVQLDLTFSRKKYFLIIFLLPGILTLVLKMLLLIGWKGKCLKTLLHVSFAWQSKCVLFCFYISPYNQLAFLPLMSAETGSLIGAWLPRSLSCLLPIKHTKDLPMMRAEPSHYKVKNLSLFCPRQHS